MANRYRCVVLFSVVLAFFVIMLGAYTRLTDAGLGCPDWPGCYGKLFLPESKPALMQAQQTFPDQIIVTVKAWTEMVHRYFAGTLGLLILILAIWASARRRHDTNQAVCIPWLLVAVVVFQAVLGMWTVTLKLVPLVVMGHLMGGMTTIGLLWALYLCSKPSSTVIDERMSALRPWALIALVIVAIQIFLGAWTSTNYAALACPNFPFCTADALMPHVEWLKAFNLFSPIGPNYEGGRLTMDARMTIHMAHRFGGLITVLYLLPLSLILIKRRSLQNMHKLGWTILILLTAQILLGILNVVLKLPLANAVLHNGFAALLLLSIITLVYRVFQRRKIWS